MELSLDVISLTQKLLGFNTMNPPGQERSCAAYLGKLLENSGFDRMVQTVRGAGYRFSSQI